MIKHKRILSVVAILTVIVALAACSADPKIMGKIGQTQFSTVPRDLGMSVIVHDGGPSAGDVCAFGVLETGVGIIFLVAAPPAGIVYEALSWGWWGATSGVTLADCLSIWDNPVAQDSYHRWITYCGQQRQLALESRTSNAYIDMGTCIYQGWFATQVAGWAVYMAWWAATFGG